MHAEKKSFLQNAPIKIATKTEDTDFTILFFLKMPFSFRLFWEASFHDGMFVYIYEFCATRHIHVYECTNTIHVLQLNTGGKNSPWNLFFKSLYKDDIWLFFLRSPIWILWSFIWCPFTARPLRRSPPPFHVHLPTVALGGGGDFSAYVFCSELTFPLPRPYKDTLVAYWL
jgi:hypothetical protein